MKCQNCGTDNLDGAKFCAKCGSSLENETNVNENAENRHAEQSNKVFESIKKFNIKDFFKTILDSIIKPTKAFEKLNKASIKDLAIYSGILIGLITIVHTIIFIIWAAVKEMFKYKIVTASTVLKECFSVLGYVAVFILLAAFIYKVTSMFVKKEVDFKKLVVGCLVGFTAVILYRYVFLTLGLFFSGKFFEILFGTVGTFAMLYSLFYTIKFTSKDFGDNEENGILINVLCLTILFVLSNYVLSEMFVCGVISL